MQIGLKLFSTNVDLIAEARSLLDEDIFDFVELYVFPGSEGTLGLWNGFPVPYIIHAPHALHGINLAQKEKRQENLANFNAARLFADRLGADIIIVHGGNNGSFDETIRQLESMDDKRIVLENKPKKGIFDESCVGWSPDEISRALELKAVRGTVLDFGHAVCAARSTGQSAAALIGQLAKLDPLIYHLSDGNMASEKDVHLNLGTGDFPLREFISHVPASGLVTIETPRKASEGLRDFVTDVDYLRILTGSRNDQLNS